jgi:hypothetical protein
MSLLDDIRDAIGVANDETSDLQPTVMLEHVITSEYGPVGYTTPVPLKAIVDWKQKQLRTPDGVLSVSRASVMFLDAQALAAATNGEGIDDTDRITLPDGTTGPILDMAGFIDAGTGHPFAIEVFLG